MALRILSALLLLLPAFSVAAGATVHSSFNGGGGISYSSSFFSESAIRPFAGPASPGLFNDPPTPARDQISLPSTGSFTISVAELLANDSDVEGGILTLALPQSNTASGGTLSLAGGAITYTPPAGSASRNDSFVYLAIDELGSASVGTVTLLSATAAARLVSIQKAPGQFTARYQGAANRAYRLQTRPAFQASTPWIDSSILVRADALGEFQFNIPILSGNAFFRAADLSFLPQSVTASGNRLALNFRNAPNQLFKLQYRATLQTADSWNDHPTAAGPLILRSASDGSIQFSIPKIAGQATAFYRTIPLFD
jgi:hypothetical protein